MRKILFVCEHNSARSQIAEAYLNHLSQGKLFAESAGLEPGSINPYVVSVMQEEGLDLSENKTKSVFELYRRGNSYDAVIAVCSSEVNQRCPLFPGRVLRQNWPFDDPSRATGSEGEKLAYIRTIRDQIKAKIKSFLQDFDDRGLRLFIDSEE